MLFAKQSWWKIAHGLLVTTVGLTGALMCLLWLSAHAQTNTNIVSAAAEEKEAGGSWTAYTSRDGLPTADVVGGVVADDKGDIWAGFMNGGLIMTSTEYVMPTRTLVSRWNGNTWVSYELPGCSTRHLATLGEQVYIGSHCGGRPGIGGGLNGFIENQWVNFIPPDSTYDPFVGAVMPEDETKVWLSTGNILFYDGLYLLDHKGTASKTDDEWTRYNLPISDNCLCDVRAITIDPDGSYWIGTAREGIWVLSPDKSEWSQVSTPDTVLGAWEIVFDDIGNAWFQAYPGIMFYDGITWTTFASAEEAIEAKYDTIMAHMGSHNTLSYLSELWAVEGEAGVWAIRDRGLSFYDGETWTEYTEENSPVPNNLWGVTVDPRGDVWVATFGEGVLRFTPNPELGVTLSTKQAMAEPSEMLAVEVTVSVMRGWVPTAVLTIANAPPSTTISFPTMPFTPTTQIPLTITLSAATPPGVYPIGVTASGAGSSPTAVFTLRVVDEVHHTHLPFITR